MSRRLAASLSLLLIAVAGCSAAPSTHVEASKSGARMSSSPTARLAPKSATAALCGSASATTPPSRYRHVIWIWMENHSYSQIIGPAGSAAAASSPYVNGTVKRQCGLATNYHNITHPSLPNYLAAVAGTTGGVTSDCGPTTCPQSARTIFAQVTAAGRAWRGYAESMPARCYLTTTTLYAARHNPAVYYPAIRPDCRRWDVPMGTSTSGAFASALASGTLPAFAFVTPNMCHDTHDCSIRTGDDWLRGWLPRITASSAYRTGRTVVFVTWDEGAGGSSHSCALNTTDPGCHVATLVLSRWTRPGTRSSRLFNHYSLLRTTEDLLGLARHLGHAADSTTAGMRSAFHL